MKITKTQLKQIIKEERQALIKENIISDMVDIIKDSGEDVWDWIKDNAEAVKDGAAGAGEIVTDFIDDLVQGTLQHVDSATDAFADKFTHGHGTAFSRQGKHAKRDRDKKYAAVVASNEKHRAETAARNAAAKQAIIDREQAEADDEARALRNKENAAANRRYDLEQRTANRLARLNKAPSRKRGYRLHPSEDEEEWRDSGEGNVGYSQSRHSPHREALDRDKLKRMIAEELKEIRKDSK